MTPKRRLAALAVAALAVTGLGTIAPAATGQGNPHAVQAAERVHWAGGRALDARPGTGAADAVRGYLADHGMGRATADSLRTTASWKAGARTVVRMQQYAGGLPVAGSDVKAVLDGHGRPLSVIENASAVSTPRAARVTADQARAAAIASIYGTRTPGWYQQPTVDQVAVPVSDGSLDSGYRVTTWDTDNQLWETVVDGSGAVASSQLRTASDAYNVFPVNPDQGSQTLVSNPAGAASPNGWLSGTEYVDQLSGNNSRTYLDTNADNAPDAPGAVDADGVFDKVFDPTKQPSAGDNRAVAAQNLFYLTNLIHDTLDAAGFVPASGNFQVDNFGRGGRGNDPVLAEVQDGGGLDNANFATPGDGKSPRMQMYLWSVPGTSQVVQGGASYNAPVAEFSAPLTVAGTTGPLVLASPATACTTLAAVPAGSIVLADRGTCDFATKAGMIKAAGAAGMIVANNDATKPDEAIVMGGTVRKFTLPAVMVSLNAGTALKAGAGAATTISLVDPAPIMKDGDLDTDIVWHEYGHGLTSRMIGSMTGPIAGGIGEGMSDVLSVIVNNDPVVGEYSASDPAGIRRHSYEGYPYTLATVGFDEVHNTGELYGAIGWDLWKRYQAAGLGQAGILEDLVRGMNYTPSGPNFQEMRDGILKEVSIDHPGRVCMVWNAFAKYGVGVNAKSTLKGSNVTVTEDFTPGGGCAVEPSPTWP